jgi:hypothetical protein
VPDEQPRDGNGKWERGIDSAERDAEACRLKARGLTYEEISEQLGYGSKANAYRAVKAAIAALPALGAEELRRVQLDQLDYMTTRVLEVLEARHFTITQSGKIVHHNGQPLYDDAPVLQAIDRFLRIQERTAKLMGLDTPARREGLTVADIDAEIARLLAEDDSDESAEAPEAEAAS